MGVGLKDEKKNKSVKILYSKENDALDDFDTVSSDEDRDSVDEEDDGKVEEDEEIVGKKETARGGMVDEGSKKRQRVEEEEDHLPKCENPYCRDFNKVFKYPYMKIKHDK